MGKGYMSRVESRAIDREVAKLTSRGVLEQSVHEDGEWVSNVFVRPKPGGEFRMILDLTELNKYVKYQHFKMFSLQTALELVKNNSWLASIDLKDAYYSVPIHSSHRKYLKFRWNKILYAFRALPNGLACAPRIFTKILAPVYANLRSGVGGHECFPYIDSFLRADTEEKGLRSVQALASSLDNGVGT